MQWISIQVGVLRWWVGGGGGFPAGSFLRDGPLVRIRLCASGGLSSPRAKEITTESPVHTLRSLKQRLKMELCQYDGLFESNWMVDYSPPNARQLSFRGDHSSGQWRFVMFRVDHLVKITFRVPVTGMCMELSTQPSTRIEPTIQGLRREHATSPAASANAEKCRINR